MTAAALRALKRAAEAGLQLELAHPDRLRMLSDAGPPPADLLAELQRLKPQVLAVLAVRAAAYDPEHWANLDTWAARMADREGLAYRQRVTREWLAAAGGPELLDRLPPVLAAIRLRRLVADVPGVLKAPVTSDPSDLAVADRDVADPVWRMSRPSRPAEIHKVDSGLPADIASGPPSAPTLSH